MSGDFISIGGLYLGTALAGALGGLALDNLGPQAIPIIGAFALLAAWVLASGPRTASYRQQGAAA